jgi:membrane-associated phospholipid phosphatase
MALRMNPDEGARPRSGLLSLPLFIGPQNKIVVGCITFLFAGAIYLLANHHPIFEPQLLAMTSFDRAIPFLPWTVLIYVSEYIYFAAVYLLCRNTLNVNRVVYSVVAIQLVSVSIFMAWPTTYPRELFPLPADLNPLVRWVFTNLRNGDAPTNCCPSLHVSSVFLCGMVFINEQREKLWPFMIWATLIGLSTLTTKQHYIVDVVTGLAMALLFHWIFYRKTVYKPFAEVVDAKGLRMLLSRINKNL